MQNWSGQPYNNPYFYKCQNCSNPFLAVGASNYGWSQNNRICGMAAINYYTDGNGNVTGLASAFANYNGSATYADGANSYGYCNAISAILQEVGHGAVAEGHSSISGDVMNWLQPSNCQCSTIDGDAQSMMLAVYGRYNGNQDCNSCNTMPVVSPSTPVLGPYLQKAWMMSQGSTAPNPVSMITPSQCGLPSSLLSGT